MIKNIRVTEKPGEIKLASFSYEVKGKKVKCDGASFKIVPTEKKKESRLFKFKPCLEKACWVFMPTQFPVRNITSFKLYKGKRLLSAGKDYVLDKQGAIGAKDKGMKPYKATAIYTYVPERYDAVFLNPKTNKLTLKKGVVRDVDAEEYIPTTPIGSIRLFNIVASGDSILVLPMYKEGDCIQKGALKNLKKKLKTGEAIDLLGYGDSITAFQILPKIGYTPNGQKHDRYKRYFSRYPNDTLEQIEKVDFGDGIGPIHCQEGWNWAFANQIVKKYKVDVNYYNCGVGGSNSSETEDNGLFPDRLNKALKVEADVAVLAFGMNELGSKKTEENMLAMIKSFKEAGTDVIIMGVPQISGTRNKREQTVWEKTNATLAKVAKKEDCPFIDTRKINLGLKPSHICSANLYNHPGIYELRKYGEALNAIL